MVGYQVHDIVVGRGYSHDLGKFSAKLDLDRGMVLVTVGLICG